jgi:hypothetical protein
MYGKSGEEKLIEAMQSIGDLASKHGKAEFWD